MSQSDSSQPPPPPLINSNDQRITAIETQLHEITNAIYTLTNHFTSAPSHPTPRPSSDDDVKSANSIYSNRVATPMPSSSTHTQQQHTPPQPHINSPSPSQNTFATSSHPRLYNGLVKFNPPPPFTGKPDVDQQQVALTNFISSMSRYLTAIGIGHDSYESLHVSSMRLSDFASQWYDHMIERQPNKITNWNTLKSQLEERYQPISQSQISLSKLLKVRYRHNIDTLNHEFLKHLQLLPEYNNVESDNLMMGIYMNSLTEASGTTYICTTLRNGIAKREINSLTELMSTALLAESSLGKGVKSNVPYVPPHRSSSSSSPSFRPSFNNNHRPSFKSNPFNRASIPSPSFSTPAKLNNIQQLDDNELGELTNPALDYENELDEDDRSEDTAPAPPSFHPDSSNDPPASDSDIMFLNAMKFLDKNAKRNPSLSLDEIDRRRRAGTCFKCNRPGHYANNCTSSSSSSSSSYSSSNPKKF